MRYGFLVVASVVLTAVAGAQGAAPNTDVLDQRNREAMNPAAEPTEISGLKGGLEGFRSITPALAQVDESAVLIDRDELRRRRLAMYEEHATYSSALPGVSSGVAPPIEMPVEEPVVSEPVTVDVDGEDKLSKVIIALIVGALAGTIVFMRRT